MKENPGIEDFISRKVIMLERIETLVLIRNAFKELSHAMLNLSASKDNRRDVYLLKSNFTHK